LKIQIDSHTSERAIERGTSVAEIEDVINNGIPIKAKLERLGKSKVFNFNQERNGKFYDQKRVEVFYIIEYEVIITVTVYVFYGKWEKGNEHTL
jgi:hypothetical protein